ncbi:MAG TPA: hypothetical protein VNP96_10190 [Solirubrobacterales bacterium]|nr:hypothetical protein [Solirubrobacterales bacterium]
MSKPNRREQEDRQVRPALALPMAVLLFVLLSVWSPATGTADVGSLEVQDYARDFGVSEPRAEATLETQRRGAGVVSQLEQALDERYAGVWFDNETGEFVVPLLPGASRNEVEDELAKASLGADFRIDAASSSWEELEATHTRLDKELFPLIGEDLVQTFLDPRTNAVVIEFAEGAGKAELEQIQSLAAAQDVRVEAREVKTERFNAGTSGCILAEKICGYPLRGGVLIKWTDPNFIYRCTAGFKAIGNTYGNRFILTAGHCATAWPTWYTRDSEDGGKEKKIGSTQAVDFPNHDWAAINANGSVWDGNPWPSMVAFWENDNQRTINAESSSYVGQQVCHAGITTGGHCGTVSKIDKTANYPQGAVHHLTEVGPICHDEGDSGGPVFAGNTALGIWSGTSNKFVHDCSVTGYYAEITEATSQLGVTVATRVGNNPSAETLAASDVQGRQATGNGKVDPNGISTTYRFEYGTTSGYGSTTQSWNAGSGWGAGEFNGTIPNLRPATTYHYRIVATNSAGTSHGADQTFTTLTAAPIATTGPVTGVGPPGVATLDGTVEPGGLSTNYRFEWGKTTSYGNNSPVPDKSVSGSADIGVSSAITGLKGLTTYHYRLFSSNGKGTSAGADQAFTTPDWRPVVGGESATPVAPGKVTLKGKVNPTGFATSYRFEWGTKTEYEEGKYNHLVPIPNSNIGSETGDVTVEQTIEGLTHLSEYHYRLVAENTEGKTTGKDQPFVADFRPIVATKAATGIDLRKATLTAAVNPVGSATTYQLEYGRTTAYGSKVPLAAEGIGSGSVAVELEEGIEGLKPNASYHYQVVATNEFGTKLGADFEFSTLPAEIFGTKGTGSGQFTVPSGMVRDSVGNVWIADSENNRIQRFNSKGEYLGQFGAKGSGNGQLNAPMGLAIDGVGNVWVADTGNNRVQKFNSKGEYLSKFGSEGTGNGQFKQPHGVAIDPEGRLWVTDSGNHRVQRFDSSGNYLEQFGSKGTASNEFDFPTGIAITSFKSVWVADSNNNRIRLITLSAGKYKMSWSFGSKGSGVGQLENPRGVGIDLEGNIWISDRNNNRIQKFNSLGTYQEQAGSKGSGNGEFEAPAALAPDSEGNVWIADGNNNRIQRWFGPPRQPTVSTEAATGPVKQQSATLNSTVNAKGAVTTYRFEYGTTTSYGNQAPAVPASIGSESKNVKVSEAVVGLTPGTTYHFRVAATNDEGTAYGEDKTFTTKPGPSAYWWQEGEPLEESKTIEFAGMIGWYLPGVLSWSCEVDGGATLEPGGGGEMTEFDLANCLGFYGGTWCEGVGTASTTPWPLQAMAEAGGWGYEYEVVVNEIRFEVEWDDWCPQQNPWISVGDFLMTPDNPEEIYAFSLLVQPSAGGAAPYGELEVAPAGSYGMEAF